MLVSKEQQVSQRYTGQNREHTPAPAWMNLSLWDRCWQADSVIESQSKVKSVFLKNSSLSSTSLFPYHLLFSRLLSLQTCYIVEAFKLNSFSNLLHSTVAPKQLFKLELLKQHALATIESYGLNLQILLLSSSSSNAVG